MRLRFLATGNNNNSNNNINNNNLNCNNNNCNNKHIWLKEKKMSETRASLLLRKQLADLNEHGVEGFSAGLIDESNIFEWEVVIFGPPDTPYEGGCFKAHLLFPKDYPLHPPRMKFISEIWHPNISESGDVCISILHDPGEDSTGYEKASERWLPVHTVETILLSVISLLSDPNDESPANIFAAREWRNSYAKFKHHVHMCVKKSNL